MRTIKYGGDWLGTARRWIQNNFFNGSSVTWESNQLLGEVTVKNIEELAESIATVHQKQLVDDIKKVIPVLKQMHQKLCDYNEEEEFQLRSLIWDFERFTNQEENE